MEFSNPTLQVKYEHDLGIWFSFFFIFISYTFLLRTRFVILVWNKYRWADPTKILRKNQGHIWDILLSQLQHTRSSALNEAKMTEILLAKDGNVEPSFEKK